MIDKRRIILFFVSLIGIVITSLVLVTTYAYQYVQTDYKGENNIGGEDGLNVANLEVSYTATNKIELSNMPLLPDYKTADYLEFTIDNTKSTGDVAYTVSLIDLNYNTKLVNSAFKYTIVRVNEDETHTIINEGDFSSLSGDTFNLLLDDKYYSYIKKGESEKLRLYLWLKESDIAKELESDISTCNESVQTGCVKFTGKLNITSVFKSDVPPKTLAEAILSDKRITKNTGTPTFNGIADYVITGDSTSGEIGMYSAEDDYGTSWYFRGAQSYNYVDFAGFTWRIVRINGDGSVRLILDGTLDSIIRKGSSEPVNITSAYNINDDDNAYLGYMYGLTGITSDYVCVVTTNDGKIIDSNITDESSCTGEWMTGYDATHMNINDSTIKGKIDLFYETYIQNKDNNYHYEKYLADTIFCGDKSIKSGKGYGTEETSYKVTARTYTENPLPTLKCAEGESNNYSRYTVGENSVNTVSTNGDLKHSIALLSADELIMAGAFVSQDNNNFYLYTNNKASSTSFWNTMSVYYYKKPYVLRSNFAGASIGMVGLNGSYGHGIRPVINLSKDVLVDTGDGTSGDGAYRVKLPS